MINSPSRSVTMRPAMFAHDTDLCNRQYMPRGINKKYAFMKLLKYVPTHEGLCMTHHLQRMAAAGTSMFTSTSEVLMVPSVVPMNFVTGAELMATSGSSPCSAIFTQPANIGQMHRKVLQGAEVNA